MTGLALGNPFGNIFEGAYDLEIAKDNVKHIQQSFARNYREKFFETWFRLCFRVVSKRGTGNS